jgi:hypothetical protein
VAEAVARLADTSAALAVHADWIASQVARIAEEAAEADLVPTERECRDLMEWAMQATSTGAALMGRVAALDLLAEREAHNGGLPRRNLKYWEEVGDAKVTML